MPCLSTGITKKKKKKIEEKINKKLNSVKTQLKKY